MLMQRRASLRASKQQTGKTFQDGLHDRKLARQAHMSYLTGLLTPDLTVKKQLGAESIIHESQFKKANTMWLCDGR